MHHVCVARFDVTGNLENFCELNKALVGVHVQPAASEFSERERYLYRETEETTQNRRMLFAGWLARLPVCLLLFFYLKKGDAS